MIRRPTSSGNMHLGLVRRKILAVTISGVTISGLRSKRQRACLQRSSDAAAAAKLGQLGSKLTAREEVRGAVDD